MNKDTFESTLNLFSTILTKNAEENSTNVDSTLVSPMITKIQTEKYNMIQNQSSFNSISNDNFHFA